MKLDGNFVLEATTNHSSASLWHYLSQPDTLFGGLRAHLNLKQWNTTFLLKTFVNYVWAPLKI